jgi:hypothetical protein
VGIAALPARGWDGNGWKLEDFSDLSDSDRYVELVSGVRTVELELAQVARREGGA